MGNKVAMTAGIGAICTALIAVFLLSAPFASASRGERGPGSLAFSIIDLVNHRLCERQDALGIRFLHPGRCGHQSPPQEEEEPSVTLSADPMTIEEGESAALEWDSDNADSCEASDGWNGEKDLSGSESVSPDETTTYTIECEGDGDTDSDSVTVTVNDNEPEMGTLIVRKLVIRDGGDETATSSFSFEVNEGDAESFDSDGENSMSVEAGTYDIVETDADGFTTSYDHCTDVVIAEGETEICTITNDDADETPAPSVNITASRTTVFEGSDDEATTTLSWDSSDATECVASNGWSGDLSADGSETVTPTATTTYAITCTGDGGTAQDSVTVDFVGEDEEPTSGNLLITEVMYDLENDDSQGTEPGNEWIELYNGTDGELDLSGYSIVDTSGASSTIPDGTTLEAGAFLVLTASSTTEGFYDIPEDVAVIVLDSELGNSLGNAGDSVLLRNDEGNAVDEVSWGSDLNAFSPAAPDASAGQTIGRTDIDVDTGAAADWEVKETPTPGQE